MLCGAWILGYSMGSTYGAWLHLSEGKKNRAHIQHSYKYMYIQQKLRVQSTEVDSKCGVTFQAVCDYGQCSKSEIFIIKKTL